MVVDVAGGWWEAGSEEQRRSLPHVGYCKVMSVPDSKVIGIDVQGSA